MSPPDGQKIKNPLSSYAPHITTGQATSLKLAFDRLTAMGSVGWYREIKSENDHKKSLLPRYFTRGFRVSDLLQPFDPG
jgi:hypothetical protein